MKQTAQQHRELAVECQMYIDDLMPKLEVESYQYESDPRERNVIRRELDRLISNRNHHQRATR